MNLPVAQLGTMGLSAKPAPVSAGAPGAFAKILNGTLESSGATPSENGPDQTTLPDLKNAIPKGATPFGKTEVPGQVIIGSGKFDLASKKNQDERQGDTQLTIVSPQVVPNSTALNAQTNGLGVPTAKAGLETTATDPLEPTIQGGYENQAQTNAYFLSPSPSLCPLPSLPSFGSQAVVPQIGGSVQPAEKTFETEATKPTPGNASTNDSAPPSAGDFPDFKTAGPAFGNMTTTAEEKTVMPGGNANDKKASSDQQHQSAPTELIATSQGNKSVESKFRELPTNAQTTSSPDQTSQKNGNGISQSQSAVSTSPSSSMLSNPVPSRPGANELKHELASQLESRTKSLTPEGHSVTDSSAMQVMVSPFTSASQVQSEAANTPRVAFPSLGKNLSRVSSSSKTTPNLPTNEPQASTRETGKAHTADGATPGGTDKNVPQVKDASLATPDASNAKAGDTARTQSMPVAGKPGTPDLPKPNVQGNQAGQRVANAPDTDANEAPTPLPGALVNSAKLIERLGRTEMRVGIQGGELGSVDIRTALGKHQFTAEISVERGELGRFLTSELPALHGRLSEHQVPFPKVTIQEYSGGSSSNLEHRSRDEKKAPPMNTAPRDESVRESGSAIAEIMMATETSTGSGIDLHM